MSVCQSPVEKNFIDDPRMKIILIFRENEIGLCKTLYLRISKQYCVNWVRVNSVKFLIAVGPLVCKVTVEMTLLNQSSTEQ